MICALLHLVEMETKMILSTDGRVVIVDDRRLESIDRERKYNHV